jgi:hypothetical protein
MFKKYRSLLFIISAIVFPTNFIFAQENNKPVIETKNFLGVTSVKVIFPDNFSGKVFTSCINGVCTSTSSPMTGKDAKDIRNRIERQRIEMENFFKQQQKLFDEMFNDTWIWNW